MTPEDKIFYTLSVDQIKSFNATGIIPHPFTCGELDMKTGECTMLYTMPQEIKEYIYTQLGIE